MVFLELLASRGVAGRWPGLREPAIWREMGRRGESDHRGGFSLSPADREQESLPALFPRPALPPAFRPGAGSATCVTRSPISVGGTSALPAAPSFLVWKRQRREATAASCPAQPSRGRLLGERRPGAQPVLGRTPHSPAQRSPPSGSIRCVLLSQFCQTLPSDNHHQPSFAAESFLILPRPPKT